VIEITLKEENIPTSVRYDAYESLATSLKTNSTLNKVTVLGGM
jgi:hypothetical protein